MRWVAAFAVVVIGAHNLFDFVKPASWGAFGWLWTVLHAPGALKPVDGVQIAVPYVLVPWAGVMALGYAIGALWTRPTEMRRKWLFRIGAFMTVLFVAVRLTNAYGDTHAWSVQKNAIFTVFSFIHCEKYPPSLLYVLMTLGPLMMLLAWLERGTPTVLRPLLVFGRVPLFYYCLHLPLLHGLAVVVAKVRFGRADWLVLNPPAAGQPPEGNGFGLPVVYGVWIAAVLVLYPLCKWFAELKARRRDPWLSYL